MTKIEFIKDHPSGKFKKGQIVEMPKGNVAVWLESGYVIVPKESGGNLGNVDTSSNDGEKSTGNSKNGGTSQKKSTKKNKKKRNK